MSLIASLLFGERLTAGELRSREEAAGCQSAPLCLGLDGIDTHKTIQEKMPVKECTRGLYSNLSKKATEGIFPRIGSF